MQTKDLSNATEEDRADFLEASQASFQTAFVKLVCANLVKREDDHDPFTSMEPKTLLVKGLSELSQQMPGQLTGVIVSSLTPHGQQLLKQYMTEANLTLY